MNRVTVTKLERPEYAGDWHDKPLKWAAVGPGNEVQKFSTRRHAEKYASFRRRSFTESDAQTAYLNWEE